MKKLLVTFCFLAVASLPVLAASAANWTNNEGSRGPHNIAININGKSLTGTVDGLRISRGSVNGNHFWFAVVRNGNTLTYKGVVNGNSMTLHAGKGRERPFTFTRK